MNPLRTTLSLDFEDKRRDALMQSVDNIRYIEPKISTENPHCFSPAKNLFVPIVNPKHPFYREQHEPFDVERYEYARPPIEIGHSRLDLSSIGPTVNVLRMPIKNPHTEYKCPLAIKPFWNLIERVAEYECGFNPRHDDCMVHITIDRGTIEKGTTHRYPGFHGDGVQGAKFSQKEYTPVEHSYVITSFPPTEFCIQPFFFKHLNDAKHNIFHEMEVQVREVNVFKTIPLHLYLLDPYMVHRTPYVEETTERIFVRITYVYSELMNPHNTVNPLFPGQQYEEKHDVRKFLTLYPGEVPWEVYGLSNGPRSR